MPQVTSVEIKKKGLNAKTGKSWTMFSATLEDGRKASGFDLVKVGDEVSVSVDSSGKYLNYTLEQDGGERQTGEAKPASRGDDPPSVPSNGDGVEEARKHIMQAANLYGICIDCTDKFLSAMLPEVAHTSEQFQSTLASIWIEASSRRCTDGVNWWSYIDKMPTTPLK